MKQSALIEGMSLL